MDLSAIHNIDFWHCLTTKKKPRKWLVVHLLGIGASDENPRSSGLGCSMHCAMVPPTQPSPNGCNSQSLPTSVADTLKAGEVAGIKMPNNRFSRRRPRRWFLRVIVTAAPPLLSLSFVAKSSLGRQKEARVRRFWPPPIWMHLTLTVLVTAACFFGGAFGGFSLFGAWSMAAAGAAGAAPTLQAGRALVGRSFSAGLS